jgi:hypothetical protein
MRPATHAFAGCFERKHSTLKRDVLRAAALALAIAGLWCLVYERTSVESWTVPVNYGGDSWFTLATLKAARDGHIVPLLPITIPELGAPFEADWNDFPRQHKLQLWLAGRLARVAGLFAASNLLLVLAAVLSGWAFYAVGRHLRSRAEWAFAGGLAFSLSPFFFYRSLPHLTLAFDWPVPLAILVVTWCFARRGLRIGSRRFWLAVGIAALTGLHNVYFAGLLAQFLVLASVIQLSRRQRRAAALAPVLLLGVLVSAVLVDNANMILHAPEHGVGLASGPRPYGSLERFALKPIELVVPPAGTGLVPWGSVADAYYQGALYRGEMGSAYLGLAGIASLVWLLIVTLRAYVRRPKGFPPATFFAVAWVLAFSVVGGLNGLLGALGFSWLRATSRYSIWIMALVLLWAVVRVSRWPRLQHRTVGLLAAAALASLALTDQVRGRVAPGEVQRLRRVVDSDRHFVRSLEAALPRGAMLFQLPVVEFPEGPRIRKASDYENLRPYLYSSSLRFSYGSDKGHPREAWQARVADLPAEALADAAERLGFAGLLVNRKAYADGGRELRERLAATGRLEAWESADGTFLFIRLRPANAPIPPGALELPADGTEADLS